MIEWSQRQSHIYIAVLNSLPAMPLSEGEAQKRNISAVLCCDNSDRTSNGISCSCFKAD